MILTVWAGLIYLHRQNLVTTLISDVYSRAGGEGGGLYPSACYITLHMIQSLDRELSEWAGRKGGRKEGRKGRKGKFPLLLGPGR